jgi:hypothetical protein
MLYSAEPPDIQVPYHRQNRRRERPGARTRHALSRKEGLSHLVQEGVSVARDKSIILPFEQARPSPLLRQSFDQSWQRWKVRGAVEKERERQRDEIESMKREQRRLFGSPGDGQDDVSSILGMLRVVRFLWGDVDYVDP